MQIELIDITKIANAAIALIAALISAFVIPLLRRWKLEGLVKTAVAAAEQLYKGSGRGEDRKAHVLAFLEKKGYTANMDDIENMIEAAVFHLDDQKVEVENHVHLNESTAQAEELSDVD